jgi:hypothetical protein
MQKEKQMIKIYMAEQFKTLFFQGTFIFCNFKDRWYVLVGDPKEEDVEYCI